MFLILTLEKAKYTILILQTWIVYIIFFFAFWFYNLKPWKDSAYTMVCQELLLCYMSLG